MHVMTKMIELIDAEYSGLTLEQLGFVFSVHENPGISVQDLADLRGAPQSTVSRQLKKLIKPHRQEFKKSMGILKVDAEIIGFGFEFVEQRINPAAPKKRALYLTERGSEFVRKISDVVGQ